MWKTQQVMQEDAIQAANIYPALIPVTRMKCSYGKIFCPLTEIQVVKTEMWGTKPARPVIRTHRKFIRGLEEKRDLGNRASPINWANVNQPLSQKKDFVVVVVVFSPS